MWHRHCGLVYNGHHVAGVEALLAAPVAVPTAAPHAVTAANGVDVEASTAPISGEMPNVSSSSPSSSIRVCAAIDLLRRRADVQIAAAAPAVGKAGREALEALGKRLWLDVCRVGATAEEGQSETATDPTSTAASAAKGSSKVDGAVKKETAKKRRAPLYEGDAFFAEVLSFIPDTSLCPPPPPQPKGATVGAKVQPPSSDPVTAAFLLKRIAANL